MSAAGTLPRLPLSAESRRGPTSALGVALGAEFVVAWRRRGEAFASLAFFAIVATMLPLGMDVSTDLLRAVGSAAIWMAALLSVVLAATRLFGAELHEGALEELLLSTQPLSLIVLARCAAHWLIYCAPLLALGPLIALAYRLAPEQVGAVEATLLLGTPTLTLLAAIGAALTLRMNGSAALLATLVLPLFVPVLIFAGAACGGSNVAANLSLLGALLCASAVLAPAAIAGALRLAVE
ncbi:MAG TPA: heme exporter protein CcmB [Burkholderiaceae bacterium]|nr:heme exporter protein CcmB [Burkholderiaceae bacterium]